MVLPARLVLLGAVVVVDGEQQHPGIGGGRAEVHARLAAVGADLEQRQPGAGRLGTGALEGEALVVGHEPDGVARHLQPPLVHSRVRVRATTRPGSPQTG